LPFFQEPFDVWFFNLVVGGDFFVATAVGAQMLAKRQMDVNGDTFMLQAYNGTDLLNP
jgi:hypothetical protein